MVKKHVRPNPQKQIKGGIAEQESSISLSNVMLVCTGCHKATRLRHEEQNGRHVRVCKRCGNSIEK
jgi:large subunit ribosomal protein L24